MSDTGDRTGGSDSAASDAAQDTAAWTECVVHMPLAAARTHLDDTMSAYVTDAAGYLADVDHGVSHILLVGASDAVDVTAAHRAWLSRHDRLVPTAAALQDDDGSPSAKRVLRIETKPPVNAKRAAAKKASNVAKIDELLAKAKSRPPKEFDPKAPMPF